MSYFQNPFAEDYVGALVLADIEKNESFRCPRNTGRSSRQVVAWNTAPYDLSGDDEDGETKNILKIAFAIDPERKNWTIISVDLTADSSATNFEVADRLNANEIFSTFFTAESTSSRLSITAKDKYQNMRFYIVNGRAEEAIRFNGRAGVAELPTYFDRHKVSHLLTDAEISQWPENANMLIPLDPGSNVVDANIIDNAVDGNGNSLGLDSGTVQADWQLLKGESGLFHFKKITVDGSDRVTEVIEYPAGARVGDFARKISRSYTGANKEPDQITEEPYTLTSGDLVTP